VETREREWDWWAYLFRVKHRATIPGIEEWDAGLIDFLVEMLRLEPGHRVLDVACGSGVHLRMLAARGIGGTGVDIAPSLVEHAAERAAEATSEVRPGYVVGDMRDLPAAVGEETFDAVTLLSGSFGFFDDATNAAVLAGMAGRLRPGGRMCLDCVSPAWAAEPYASGFDEFDGGILLSESWFEPETCTRTGTMRFLDSDGVMNTAAEPERIRVYSLPEFRGLLDGAGLSLVGAYGANSLPAVPYDREHPRRLVVVAERP
jgi:SAM-dependent methyltransferase